MNNAYLLLGTNEGNKFSNLEAAIASVKEHIGKVIVLSSVYETEPWGFSEQPVFYNQVLLVETVLSPQQILLAISETEKNMGRNRGADTEWKQRIIDIDILFYNDSVLETPDLTIPHPRLHERNFTLSPLAEIAGQYRHPVLDKTVSELAAACKDVLKAKKIIADTFLYFRTP